MRLLPTLLLALPALAFAQGALVPTGAPAPTMRTLDQLEPRIPLGQVGTNTTTLSITQPGSYVLMGNVTVAAYTGIFIQVGAGSVTLDLNGFTVSSTASPAGGTAIYVAQGPVTIRNGHIRGAVTPTTATTFTTAGFENGIDATYVSNVCVENVSVEAVSGYGISLAGGHGIIRSCRARYCGTIGLCANQVVDSIALNCVSNAIHASTVAGADGGINGSASNCTGDSIGGSGIFADTATNCFGSSASGIGIESTTAVNCHGRSLTGTRGLVATRNATNCTGEITTATCPPNTPFAESPCGLFATTAENCTGTITTASGRCFGLSASTATNCTGTITAGSDSSYSSAGLTADSATGCRGECPHCPGLGARVATNCTGFSTNSLGLSAGTATNCYGSSTKYTGLKAHGTATGCRGSTSGTGSVYAIEAAIAVACTAESGTINAPQKFLGTP